MLRYELPLRLTFPEHHARLPTQSTTSAPSRPSCDPNELARIVSTLLRNFPLSGRPVHADVLDIALALPHPPWVRIHHRIPKLDLLTISLAPSPAKSSQPTQYAGSGPSHFCHSDSVASGTPMRNGKSSSTWFPRPPCLP